MVSVTFFVAVLTDELEEYGGEQHENESLNEADEQLHEVERNRRKPSCVPFAGDGSHGFQCGLTGEDVAEKTEGKGDWAEYNRNQFEQSDETENYEHHYSHDAGEFAFWCEDVFEKSDETVFRDRPIEPEEREGDRHGKSHVEVGVTTA